MSQYYHATSYENAKSIERNGFYPGKSGMLGGAMYFGFKPKDALSKAHGRPLNAIVVVRLNTGKILTEKLAHNWNLNSLKKLGYDSVQMLHCRTGPEIAIYERNRITIIGIVHWDERNIEFYEIDDYAIDMTDLMYLVENKNYKLSNSKKGTGIIMNGLVFNSKINIISKGGNNIIIKNKI